MALAEQLRSYGVAGTDKFITPAPRPSEYLARTSVANRAVVHRDGVGFSSPARRLGADVRLPCMLYAAVGARAGDAGSEAELAISQIRRMHGVLHVLSYDAPASDAGPASSSGIAVVTRGYWFSRQALARLMAQCGGAVGMFGWDAQAEAAEADARVTRGTAQFIDGHLHLWLATVDAVRSRARAARIAGVAQDRIDLRVVGQPQSEAGHNVLFSAIALARALQPAPVQVIVAQDLEQRPQTTATRAEVPALSIPVCLRIASGKELAA